MKTDGEHMAEHDGKLDGTRAWAEPEDLGLDPGQLNRAYGVLERFVAEERIPGIVALVGDSSGMLAPYTSGWASLIPEKVPVTQDHLFDMASVTKVVATTTAVLQLVERGVWRLDDRVAQFWPEFRTELTLRRLLTHTSGLPAWLPVYKEARGPEEYRRKLAEVALKYKPGTHVEYSCLGFLILGGLVEEVTGQPFDAYCRENIFEPLSMADTLFNPQGSYKARCAATEQKQEDGLPLQGEVHDENARVRGGVAGNAGLFSTAYDMGLFCQALLNGGALNGRRILSRATVELATMDHTAHLNESRGLGWVVKGTRTHSSAGDLLSPRAYGHTGFTGTSVWIDPENDLFVVLLTNRVHPTRENSNHIRLRALFHNAVAAAL